LSQKKPCESGAIAAAKLNFDQSQNKEIGFQANFAEKTIRINRNNAKEIAMCSLKPNQPRRSSESNTSSPWLQ